MAYAPGPSGDGRRDISGQSDLSDTTKLNALAALTLADSLGEDDTAVITTDENLDLSGTTDEKLKKYMSFRRVVSTASSLARRNQKPDPNDKWRQIGRGSQGVVFEELGSRQCFKLQLHPGVKNIENNFKMQQRVHAGFAAVRRDFPKSKIEVYCPGVGAEITTTSSFWNKALDKIEWEESGYPPSEYKKPKNGYIMERIFPVPEPFRRELINKYCAASAHVGAMNSKYNKHCLVRVMLGDDTDPTDNTDKILRNFPMDVAKFQELQLPARQYAEAIACGMAVLHWQVHIDAHDVEFVLGSSPTVKDTDSEEPNFLRRTMALWVIDFDLCKTITPDENGVNAAVQALGKNFYCPRPGSGIKYREELWEVFRNHYLAVSGHILGPRQAHFADKFIKGMEGYCADWRKRRATPSRTPNPPASGVRGHVGERSWSIDDDLPYQAESSQRRANTGGGTWRARGRGGNDTSSGRVQPGRGMDSLSLMSRGAARGGRGGQSGSRG